VVRREIPPAGRAVKVTAGLFTAGLGGVGAGRAASLTGAIFTAAGLTGAVFAATLDAVLRWETPPVGRVVTLARLAFAAGLCWPRGTSFVVLTDFAIHVPRHSGRRAAMAEMAEIAVIAVIAVSETMDTKPAIVQQQPHPEDVGAASAAGGKGVEGDCGDTG